MPSLRIAAFAAVVFVCGAVDGRTQSVAATNAAVTLRAGVLRVAVDDVKPLFRAVYELERLCGCAITYEDAPLEHSEDVVEVSPGRAEGRRRLNPRGGKLDVSLPLDSLAQPAAVESAVRELVRVYEQQRLPGEFDVLREGGMLHVVPTSVRRPGGLKAAIGSVLDTPVSFPAEERSGIETVTVILEALASAGGPEMPLVQAPMNLLARQRMRIGADREPARTVLMRVLASQPTPMSWGIGYDIVTKRYGISLHVVPPATATR